MGGDECAENSDKWVLCGLGPSTFELVNKFFGNRSLIAENEEVSLEEDWNDGSRPQSYSPARTRVMTGKTLVTKSLVEEVCLVPIIIARKTGAASTTMHGFIRTSKAIALDSASAVTRGNLCLSETS